MRCEECGADIPGEETCLDRFHAVLAAEVENDELREMHGLTVLTYHLQHPSLTKPWFQVTGAETMRRVFAGGEDWGGVLMEVHPRGVGRRRSAARVARMKAASDWTPRIFRSRFGRKRRRDCGCWFQQQIEWFGHRYALDVGE